MSQEETSPQDAPPQDIQRDGNAVRPVTGAGQAAPDVEQLLREEKAGPLVTAARIALQRGRRDEARSKLQQAFALHPTDSAAIELLGDIFFEEGEQEKAIEVFERGLKYHPQQRAFEEKIALAYIDLEEMRCDRLLKEQGLATALQHDGKGVGDRNPTAVALLSLLLPGAGQFYNDEPDRGAVFFAIALALFCAWCVPWRWNISLGGFEKLWIGVMVVAWIAAHIAAAVDAARGAMREVEERKRILGV